MVETKRKVVMGEHVVIIQKDGSESSGMVRRILRDYKGELLVELFDGSIGQVTKVLPRRPRIFLKPKPTTKMTLTPVKIIRGNNKVKPQNQKETNQDLFSGERSDLEYKLSALWSQDLSREELEKMKTPEVKKYGNKTSKIILAKVIAGFLNSEGGDLLIGIKEEKGQGKENEIVGVDSEFHQLKNKDFGEDGYRRMIMDDVIRPHFSKEIFNHFNNYFSISFPKVEGKTLCKISVKKSEKEVFVTINTTDYFFIRVDTQTRELRGKEVVDYVRRRFV